MTAVCISVIGFYVHFVNRMFIQSSIFLFLVCHLILIITQSPSLPVNKLVNK